MFDRGNRNGTSSSTHGTTKRQRPAGRGRLEILGVPDDVPVEAAAAFRGRLTMHAGELFDETGLTELRLVVRCQDSGGAAGADAAAAEPHRESSGGLRRDGGELDLERRMSYFTAVTPAYDLKRLVLPEETLEELHQAVDTVRLKDLVFGTWGLGEIEPNPRTAIGLHGPPGTGKTMVAHALARHLGKRILPARTSQLESKYHGEGGKYLAALFEAARRADAVLFIDEAESLLSRRFESVSQGAEHAVNTLRSELIQHLDAYEGVVIFATNLVQSYDPAISSRLHHVRIPEPDVAARSAIWSAHLPKRLPLADDVSPDKLARTGDIVGRDIKRVVINAAVAVARRGGAEVGHADLERALGQLLAQRPALSAAAAADEGDGDRDGEVSEQERAEITEELRKRRRS